MKSLRLLVCCCVLATSSCATKFTAAQRESLSTVAISPTEVDEKAYSEPYGGDRAGTEMARNAGVNAGAGALGGLVGSLVAESIAATQDNMFRSKSKDRFAAVQTNTPQVGPILNGNLTNSLKDDGFFSSRIRNSSPNTITSRITSYRLVRSGKNADGDLLLTPQITSVIELKDGDGKKLAGGTYVGTAGSLPISTYARSATESRDGYGSASQMAVNGFLRALAVKTEE
jgi:hypothetical protein